MPPTPGCTAHRLDRLQLDGPLLTETARHLALWMSYEDTIRVADLKTRASRLARVRAEVRVKPDQVLRITEFMHPRVQEMADTLPAPIGRWLLRSRVPRRLLERLTARAGTSKPHRSAASCCCAASPRCAVSAARTLRFVGRAGAGSKRGWGGSGRWRNAIRRWRWRSRAASAW